MATDSTAPQYNKDELIPPNFLNQNFFLEVLQKEENDEALEITNFKIIPGTKPGDHFASIMFKAIISYTTKGRKVSERSLVVKTMPIAEGLKKDMLENMPIFDREIKMYTKVLPEMKRIMESIGDYEKIAPRMIYHSEEPPIIIFEDITKLGYKMHEEFFNFSNTEKIVKKLAKFHALSFYINDNKYANDLHLSELTGVLLNEKSIIKFQLFSDALAVLKDYIKNWPGYEEISDKIAKLEPTFVMDLLKFYKSVPEPGINVLCHADFQIKNMMYSMHGEDIDEIFFLDFQLCFWAPPTLDLLYVMYEVGDATVRRRQSEILMIYHNEFTNYLNRLGCLRKGPTLLDLNIDILKLGHLEILIGLCFLPMFLLHPSEIDVDNLMDPIAYSKERYFGPFYKNPKITEILKEILKSLFHKGILD